MRKYIVVHSVKVATEFVPEAFGRLTTIGPAFRITCGKKQRTRQVCECVCGAVAVVRTEGLQRGHTKSCGCLQKDRTIEVHTTHGHRKEGKPTPEYTAWQSMINRCYNKNHRDYRNWGGRGIRVFPEWLGPGGFERWLAHIGPMLVPGLTQERDNVNGNYEPGNVRWATSKEQGNNRRTNRFLTHNGETKTLAQWVEITGINRETVKGRLARGWATDRALTEPVKQ